MAGKQKPKRNVKYNPDALKHVAPGKKPVMEYDLPQQDMAQLVMLENIRRMSAEAQTNYMLKLCNLWGYPDGIRCNFDMDWEKGKLRVTMIEKAQPAALKGTKVTKEK